MKLDANKKILIGVALVLYILYKMMGGWIYLWADRVELGIDDNVPSVAFAYSMRKPE